MPTAEGPRQIPLSQLASVTIKSGPSMIRIEEGLLNGYVCVDTAGRDPAGCVDEAARVLAEKVTLPPGYALLWSGQYGAMQGVKERLVVVLPHNMSVRVWVGLIALLGVDAETGVFMLLYLDSSSRPAPERLRPSLVLPPRTGHAPMALSLA